MKLRAIVVDDEPKGLNSLSLLIERHCPEVKLVASSLIASKAIELIEDYLPDIVFLDINMPEMNGFDLLSKLKWKKFNLIFTTAHQEYALKALKSNAIDYLLKPLDHEELILAVKRAVKNKEKAEFINDFSVYSKLIENLNQNPIQKLVVNSKDGVESIELNEIISLESKSNYTLIYLTNSKTIRCSKTLKEFENILCQRSDLFMRVHHSFIINLTKVSRYLKMEENIVMQDQQNIPVSRSRRESFFSWLKV